MYDPVPRAELIETVGNIVRRMDELRKLKIPTPPRSRTVHDVLQSRDQNPGRAWVEAFNGRHMDELREAPGRVIENKRLNVTGLF
jgi:hypothetical protein